MYSRSNALEKGKTGSVVEESSVTKRKKQYAPYGWMFRQAQHDNMENFEFYRLKHQADNLAKLRQEFLSVTKLIAKIFGAVSRTKA